MCWQVIKLAFSRQWRPEGPPTPCTNAPQVALDVLQCPSEQQQLTSSLIWLSLEYSGFEFRCVQAAADLAEQQFRVEEEAYRQAEQMAARNRAEAAAAKEVRQSLSLRLSRLSVLDCFTRGEWIITVLWLF